MRRQNILWVAAALISFSTACKKTLPAESGEEGKEKKEAQVNQPPETGISEPDTLALSEPEPVPEPPSRPDTVSVIGVGDMMLGTIYPYDFRSPEDGKELLVPVHSYLQNADVTFGNLEGCLFEGEGTPKKCSDPSKCYAFKSPEYYADYFKEAGFDLLSLANNHMGDFGDEGRKRTVEILKEKQITAAGLLDKPYAIYEKDGIKYGLAAFSPFVGTIDINDYENARSIVRKLDTLADITIVSFHGGAEGSRAQHVTRETEMFYGEDRGNVYEFSHEMIDAGADIIFGHGPHVTRAVELYNDRIIAYSLGNFCTYRKFNLSGPNGMAPILKVYTDAEGKFHQAEVIPVIQKGEGGPEYDPEKKVIKVLRALTNQDFPEGILQISNEGLILKKQD